MVDTVFRRLLSVPGLICVGLVLVGARLAEAHLSGALGALGPDGDDVMRFVQIQDFLAGQSWFDVSQTRLGPPGGADMHWSRVVDAPILALAYLFGLLVSPETALVWAYSLWPPLSLFLVLFGVMWGARHFSTDVPYAPTFALVLGVLLLASHYRFAPGAIDHHNVQLGLMAIALGAALDPQMRLGTGAIAGGALALSAATGVEVYAFVFAACGYFAVNWAVSGEAARRSTLGFGLAFAGVLASAFAATISPARYGLDYCESLSRITLLVGVAGGLGLAGLAAAASPMGRIERLVSICGLGLVCAALVRLQAPQCLASPLGDLPEIVRVLWLETVDEAQPLFAVRPNMVAETAFQIGASVVAIAVVVVEVLRRRNLRANALLLTLLVFAAGMTVVQVRFYVFGHLFALLPLAVWVGRIFAESAGRDRRSVAYLAALAASAPSVWAMPFAAAGSADAAPIAVSASGGCAVERAADTFNALPAGRILSGPDHAAPILHLTAHSALAGNYHRNIEGLQAALELYTEPPASAPDKLTRMGVDYVVYCANGRLEAWSQAYPDGLAARLAAEDPPDFLTLQAQADGLWIYRVHQASVEPGLRGRVGADL